ncbi:MAG: hypothetical protein V2A74_13050 [bacterium]
MIVQTIILCLFVLVTHSVLGVESFTVLYISQMKETSVWYLGYLIFLGLISLLSQMCVILFRIRSFGFLVFYLISDALAITLMLTPSISGLHILAYFVMIGLVISTYWAFLWFNDEYLMLGVFSISLMILLVWVWVRFGGPMAQKCLLLYYFLIMNLHYYASKDILRLKQTYDGGRETAPGSQ